MNLHRTLAALLLATAICLAQDAPKRVSTTAMLSAATSKVAPEYPPMAQKLNIAGSAEVDVEVSEAGVVDNVKILSGNPLLTKAAVEAVKKWKFHAITADGKVIRVVATMSFDFKK